LVNHAIDEASLAGIKDRLTMLHFLSVGQGTEMRRIAIRIRDGSGPPVVWLGGFKSDMSATKASWLDAWAERTGREFVRFDYSGHGESEGTFEEGTISRWLEESRAVLDAFAPSRPVLVGSSMGGHIALLLTRTLPPERLPRGVVLIAPAVDFTEHLVWNRLPEDARHAIRERGYWERPSAYSPEPYRITRDLIEDGRQHLLLGSGIATGCPVHILQGMEDPDVPWQHALTLVEHLPGESVALTLINDGDHRLSRPQDLERLVDAVEAMAQRS
jgi:pimeloyl-ACP methyl ester carboxylesterase